MLDADLDGHNNSLFAIGTDKAATHLLFGSGALVRLPAPLYSCRARLVRPETALVWGAVRPPHDEPNAWMVDRSGSIRETFSAIRYCDNAICTNDYVVLTYFEDAIGNGNTVSAEGIAVFDQTGMFVWGWNSTMREVGPVSDCDAAVGLGGNLIGVFASHAFPLVVLDISSGRPIALHRPTPRGLHGAHAISMRDGVWYFVAPYEAKEAILSWNPERGKPKAVGRLPARQRYRGLAGGRFISVAQGIAELLRAP